jgi:hypothetical protein
MDRRRFRGFANPAEPKGHVAIFVPTPFLWEFQRKLLKIIEKFASL